ncbi:MAG: hypothetical protein ISR58_12175 [Anaerolineales bacterium]|nr:hypothetical protein [Chloroflexota bacterium]MBL6981934.1 hypothetical protein [Anaerolineales bacterium]
MAEDKSLVPEEIAVENPGKAIDLVQETLDNFLDVADVNRVYGKPVNHDDTVIIPAAEVVAAMGFGAGYGEGVPPGIKNAGGGGGGGGGGKALSRPVAVIIASPEGVRVEPVIDPTKVAITALTALGFVFATITKMKRGK